MLQAILRPEFPCFNESSVPALEIVFIFMNNQRTTDDLIDCYVCADDICKFHLLTPLNFPDLPCDASYQTVRHGASFLDCSEHTHAHRHHLDRIEYRLSHGRESRAFPEAVQTNRTRIWLCSRSRALNGHVRGFHQS